VTTACESPLCAPDVQATHASSTVHRRVAYLLNQYPQPSQTFIRRELMALEQLGQPVERFTIRSWEGTLVDPEDIVEKRRTRVVLGVGMLGLVRAMFVVFISRPWSFFSALRLALTVGWTGERGLLRHLVYLAEACVLLRWWTKTPIDHVHAHFGTNATTVAMLTRRLGGPPYSFTVNGPEEFDRPESLHLSEKIRHAQFVVAISSFGRSQLCRWSEYGSWAKLRVVRCGLDKLFLSQPLTPPSQSARIVCVARLEEQKGLFVLIEAAAALRRAGVDFELTVIGDGRLRRPIEQLIDRYDLSQNVRLLGWQSSERVRQELLASRALVLPSFAEGLPVVIMESFALGRPVVSTYVGGIAELVEPGICGWLVPAGAAEPLTAAMRAVLEAPVSLLAEYGAAGARRVAEQHVATKEAAALLAAISGVSNEF
jgi:colanic acid/amylovoran biosynthesis glycosyltransferase